ncbi:MAG: tetratricopeptide repeat protein, partial [Bacteroidetes bacterium]|nr:tetratricopeptide repeat protein [Bacteroidota bacterium]
MNVRNKSIFFKIFLLISLLSVSDTFAEQSKLDSLLIVLKTAKDTNKVRVLNDLCWEYRPIDPDKALQYGKKALSLGKKSGFKFEIAKSLNNLGNVYLFQSGYEKAIEYYRQALKIQKELKNKQEIAASINNIGVVYMYQGNYEKTLEFFIKSLKMREGLGNTQEVAASLGNVGIVYWYLGNYEKAIEYYLQCIDTARELGDKQLICGTLNNIGAAYQYQGISQLDKEIQRDKYEKSLHYYRQSLKLAEALGNKQYIAANLVNMGDVYTIQESYQKAIKSWQKALKVEEKLGEKHVIAEILNNLGEVYRLQGNYEKAIDYSKKSLAIAKEIGSKENIKNAYKNLSEIYASLNQFKSAYKYHKLFSQIKDSLFNEQSSKQIAEMQTKYETEKKEEQIKLFMKDLRIKELEIAKNKSLQSRQKIVIISVITALVLISALAFLAYNRYRFKQKANALLEKKNKQITDSINYASRIQQAILPQNDLIEKLLPDSFILFKPRDIVSGDFYWLTKIESESRGRGETEKKKKILNEKFTDSPPPASSAGLPVGRAGILPFSHSIIIAAVDCTGHGVPGAFMSMIGNTLLNEIINEKGITKPSDILEELNSGIKKALHQNGQETHSDDGMDISLVSIDPEKR